MNILQFWLIDSIVKAHTPPLSLADDSSRHGPSDEDREPLFQADGSDEEDETADESGSTPAKYDVENPEPSADAKPSPRSLTPESRTLPSGSSTPFHCEVNLDDVAMRRVQSPPQHPTDTVTKQTAVTAGDDWAWDEAGEEWDTKRSLDALRPHHD